MGMSQGYGEVDGPEAKATIDAALDTGVTLLDTTMSYGAGANERLLAQVLRRRRDKVVLATKFGIVRDTDGTHLGVSETTTAELEQAAAVHPIAALQLEWSLT